MPLGPAARGVEQAGQVPPKVKEKSIAKQEVLASRRGFVKFVSRLTTIMQKTPSPLCKFVRRFFLHHNSNDINNSSNNNDIARLPIGSGGRPFPCQPRYGVSGLQVLPRSNQRKERYTFTRSFRRVVNIYAGVQSWCALGRPARPPLGSRGVSPLLHSTAASALDSFEEGLWVLAHEPGAFAGVSGGRAAVAAMLAQLAEGEGSSKWHSVCDDVCDERGEGEEYLQAVAAGVDPLLGVTSEELNERPAATADMAFCAERFGLPDLSIKFPLQKWAGAKWGRILADPDLHLPNPCPKGPCPPVCLRATRPEWLSYVGRLARATMAKGLPHKVIPKGPNQEELWAGAFPVPKSKTEDRAITDRRRKNWSERDDLPRPKMPIGCQFVKRILHKGKVLRHQIFDLPHFYHHLCPGALHLKHSPLGPPLTRAEAESIGLVIEEDDGSDVIQPCLDVLAMGDKKAVALAQSAHEGLIRAAGIQSDQLVHHGAPPPLRGTRREKESSGSG